MKIILSAPAKFQVITGLLTRKSEIFEALRVYVYRSGTTSRTDPEKRKENRRKETKCSLRPCTRRAAGKGKINKKKGKNVGGVIDSAPYHVVLTKPLPPLLPGSGQEPYWQQMAPPFSPPINSCLHQPPPSIRPLTASLPPPPSHLSPNSPLHLLRKRSPSHHSYKSSFLEEVLLIVSNVRTHQE